MAPTNLNHEVYILDFTRAELPKIKENSTKKIVEFGDDNLYPKTLIDVLNTSAIHNAIVEAKANAIVGDGVQLRGNVSTETTAMFENWCTNPNPDEDLTEILDRVALDFETHGAFALEVIWTKDGSAITEINHLDVSKVRLEPVIDGVIEAIQYSRDWSQHRKSAYQPITIPTFDPERARQDGRQVLYVKNYRPGNEYYGIPSYISALSWIQLDAELGLFHLSNIKNGLTPSMHFSFKNGVPTLEEQKKMFEKIKKQYQGTSNTGKFILTFSDGSDTAPEFTPIETTSIDQLYVVLNDLIIQNILTAHRVTSPMILGVKTEGQLGGASELDTAFQIFDKTVIQPSRKRIEATLNRLLKHIIPGATLELVPSNPIDFRLSESVLSRIMTVNELRARVNLPELADEELSVLQLSTSKVTCDCGVPLDECSCTRKLNNAA